MRYLFSLLKRSRIFLLFLLLEGIALGLVISQRSYQRSVFFNQTSRVTGEFQKNYNLFTRYLFLDYENEQLSKENTRLQNLLDRSKVFQSFGADTIGDSIFRQRYVIISGRVISSSYHKRNNYLTLDKGKISQVKPGMGVSGPAGVVGVVQGVSSNFASVLPLINPDLEITGKFKNSNYFGPVRWDGEDYTTIYISDIPRYANIREGDTIITDSRSLIFPEGLMIGIAGNKILQEDQNFYRIEVKLSTDFSKLEHVYVIKDNLRTELDSLNP